MLFLDKLAHHPALQVEMKSLCVHSKTLEANLTLALEILFSGWELSCREGEERETIFLAEV